MNGPESQTNSIDCRNSCPVPTCGIKILKPRPGATMHFGLTPNMTQPTHQKPQYNEAGLTEDPV